MTAIKNTRKKKGWLIHALFILVFLSLFLPARAVEPDNNEKLIANYFERIRMSPVFLRQFLLEMPKGGDLHNHITGAAYAETLIDLSVNKKLCITPDSTLLANPPKIPGITVPISSAYKNSDLYMRIIENWSMYNFHPASGNSNEHFFNIFGQIGMADTNFSAILNKLRIRAAQENMDYIETMLQIKDASDKIALLAGDIAPPDQLNNEKDYLDFREKLIKKKEFTRAVDLAAAQIHLIKKTSDAVLGGQPGAGVETRFQYYAFRVLPRNLVLAEIIAAFAIADKSPLVVGTNIVGPENAYTSRKDYEIHMKMISVIGNKYPSVKKDLHAGELVLGESVPEALRFHVRQAVEVAGANRIGHGVDIAYEKEGLDTIKKMRDRKVAIEILLTSNEELLGVKNKEHPFPFYVEAGVPVVLAGDDPGMMRTTQTQEFYLAVSRYPGIKYRDIKSFVYNSIQYSFLEFSKKQEFIKLLDKKFKVFEEKWATKFSKWKKRDRQIKNQDY